MKTLLMVFLILALCGLVIGWYEITHAHKVDDKYPFLHDDYDENNDPTKDIDENNNL